jgi:hypothetical protein
VPAQNVRRPPGGLRAQTPLSPPASSRPGLCPSTPLRAGSRGRAKQRPAAGQPAARRGGAQAAGRGCALRRGRRRGVGGGVAGLGRPPGRRVGEECTRCWGLGAGGPPQGGPHAERGRPSAGHVDQPLRAAHGRRGSRSEQGACGDTAVAERSVGRFQGAGTALRHAATRQAAREAVVEDIEMCDNRPRSHAHLGYVSPKDSEALAQVA